MAAVEFVDSITPPWAKGAQAAHWWKLFRFAAVLVDLAIAGVYHARRASFANMVDLAGVPAWGGYEDIKALQKYLAPDAVVLQGLTESPLELARRVRHAQDAASNSGWPAAGTITGVLEQLAQVLGPTPPLMRAVNRNGDWWTRYQDGHYDFARTSGLGLTFNLDGTTSLLSTVAHAWDWDSASHPTPPTAGELGDWWLILYEPLEPPYGTTTDLTFNDPGQFADLWNSPVGDPGFGAPGAAQNPWGGTFGTNAPYALVELVRAVIGQRQTAGFNCLWIIIATDPASFSPDGSSSPGASRTAYPDGTWAWHTTWDAGSNTRVVARLKTAEYWLGPRSFGQNT